jgi:hypothetical protein
MVKIVLVLLLLLLLVVTTVGASSSASYILRNQVLSSGGGKGVGDSGEVAMAGTIGQSVVGETTSDNYTIISGFWSRLPAWVQEVFLPLIVRD